MEDQKSRTEAFRDVVKYQRAGRTGEISEAEEKATTGKTLGGAADNWELCSQFQGPRQSSFSLGLQGRLLACGHLPSALDCLLPWESLGGQAEGG